MKAITLSNWTNQDMHGMPSYVTSYTLRAGHSELFTIHLNRQLGFYQISEFISADAERNFIIEQTNRVDAPKIAAFDKNTGNMLGAFQGNTLLDADDEPVFHVKQMISLSTDCLCAMQGEGNPEDYAAVLHEQKNVAAIFSRLPRGKDDKGLISRMRHWTNRLSSSADVLEALVIEEDVCDLRMICAVAVILHSRGGLHLHKPNQ